MAPAPEPKSPGIPSPQSWPSASKGFEVDRSVLKKVAQQLQADYDKLAGEGAGTEADLVDHCAQLDVGELGQYPGGTAMAGSTSKAYLAIKLKYVGLLSAYKSVIDTLNQTTKNYGAAEDANEHASGGHQLVTASDGNQAPTNVNTRSFN